MPTIPFVVSCSVVCRVSSFVLFTGAQRGQWRRIFWLFVVLARGGQASGVERAGEVCGKRRKAARVLDPFSFAENVQLWAILGLS